VAEAEVAGGSPRKKPHGPSPRKKPRGEETFLLRLDRAKATVERGRTEPIGLKDPPQGDPDDRAETGGVSEGGRPEKRTTKPPPVTQEDAGAGDLDSEEEEFDEDDDDDDGLERRSIANDRTVGGRPKEDDDAGDLDDVDDEHVGDLGDDDEELDDGDIKDPPHQVAVRRWTEDVGARVVRHSRGNQAATHGQTS
jgi:hypothetical protein